MALVSVFACYARELWRRELHQSYERSDTLPVMLCAQALLVLAMVVPDDISVFAVLVNAQ